MKPNLSRRSFSAVPARPLLFGLATLGSLSTSAVLLKAPSAQAIVSTDATVAPSLGHRVTLVARPADSNHDVTAVRFLLDGRTLAEVGPPGRYEWDTRGLRVGRHIIQVQAFSGELLVGLSEPMAVRTGELVNLATSTIDLSFSTYAAGRSVTGITAPRLPVATAGGAAIAPATGEAAARISGMLVDVYLNGVKLNFAPPPRLASAEELRPKTPPRATSRSRSRRARTTAIKPSASSQAQLRTVWMPARPLLQRLGARVRYETASKTLRAELNIAGATRRITLTAADAARSRPGMAHAEIDGHHFALRMPVRQADNAIMVPLEFCTQALNLRVNWHRNQRRVEMFTPITPA